MDTIHQGSSTGGVRPAYRGGEGAARDPRSSIGANQPPKFIDIDALCDEAEKAGTAWAQAKAAADLLEETKKTVLSRCMLSRIEKSMPVSRAETFALADPIYENFIKGMVAAGEARDIARVRYDILRTRIELLRTNASTERAAMSMR